MAKEVTMYLAEDRTVFATKHECDIYDAAKEDEKKINGFLNSEYNPYTRAAHKTVAKAAIKAYCNYLQHKGPVVAKEEEKAKEVQEKK